MYEALFLIVAFAVSLYAGRYFHEWCHAACLELQSRSYTYYYEKPYSFIPLYVPLAVIPYPMLLSFSGWKDAITAMAPLLITVIGIGIYILYLQIGSTYLLIYSGIVMWYGIPSLADIGSLLYSLGIIDDNLDFTNHKMSEGYM